MRGLLALCLLVLPFQAGAQVIPYTESRGGIGAYGDSITRGSDDSTVPPDNGTECATPPDASGVCNGGWVPALARFAGEKMPRTVRMQESALGGIDSQDATNPQQCADSNPNVSISCYLQAAQSFWWAERILYSLHVNDTSIAPATTRTNNTTVLDHFLTLSRAPDVIFWKSPGVFGRTQDNILDQFDATCDPNPACLTDTLDDLFAGTDAGEYGNEPRVTYVETLYDEFAAHPTWWFAADDFDTGGIYPGAAHIHPNGLGYSRMAGLFCDLLSDCENERPTTPTVSASNLQATSIDVTLSGVSDADGDSLTCYAWAVCADTDTLDDGTCDAGGARDPGAYAGSDRATQTAGNDYLATAGDTATPDGIPDYFEVACDGSATITHLSAGTDYTLAAIAWDGFEVSDIGTDSATTGSP